MSLTPGEATLQTADGASIFYRIVGDGPPALYVHPFQNPTTRVAEIVPFRKHFSWIMPHPRGMLRSSEATSPEDLSTERLVSDLEELRQQLGVERWVLHGRSEGGFVVLSYAARYPERVAGLLLFATAPSYEYLVKQEGQFDTAHPGFPLLTATLWQFLAAPNDRSYAAYWTARARILMRARAVAQGKPVSETPRPWATVADIPSLRISDEIPQGAALRYHRFLHDILGYDVRPQLPQLDVPALVIAGRHDPFCTVDQSEELAALLPQAELIVLENAAHAITMDAGDEIEAAVNEFVSQHDLGKS